MRKALVLSAVLAFAPLGAAPARAAPSDLVALGCSVASTAAIAAAVAINARTLSGVVSGAAVVPFSPALMYGGLTAIMVSSVCALGYAVAPVVAPDSPAPVPVPVPIRPLTAGSGVAQAVP